MGPHETAAAPLPVGGGGPNVINVTQARQLIARLDKLDANPNSPVDVYARWVSDAYRFLTEMVRDA